MVPALDLTFNKAIFGVKSDPLTSRVDVSNTFS